MYSVYIANSAEHDYEIINKSVYKKKVEALLTILKNNPFQNPPPYEKLEGKYKCYSRRINKQHRLVYQVDKDNKRVKILRIWTHYGDN